MKPFLLVISICISLSVSSQDLTGIWRGNFRQNATNTSRLMELLGSTERYKFEVQLDQQGKSFHGVTYSYLTTIFYGKADCKGTVNPSTRKVLLEEIRITDVKMASGSDPCIMTLFLQYSKIGEDEFLEGTFSSMNTRDSTNCGRGTVFLRKVPTSDFYKEPFLVEREKEKARQEELAKKKVETQKKVTSPPVAKKPEKIQPKTTPKKEDQTVVITPADPVKDKLNDANEAPLETPAVPTPPVITPPDLANRENELVKTIYTRDNEVLVKIYDNGAIDNDTVSVYLDKKPVLLNKKLTDQPLLVKIKLDEKNNYHELVMVAENLGEIPPNTSLMVVHAGNKQYEVRITSTEQKNAVVIFKYGD